MVQQHELAVLLPDDFFGDAPFSATSISIHMSILPGKVVTYGTSRINAASLLFIVDSKPPL
jgi:hypothetical protein